MFKVGQKLGEKIDSSGLKALLAILLLLVGIAIAYDTFFAEQTEKEIIQVINFRFKFFLNIYFRIFRRHAIFLWIIFNYVCN